jgi:hypothetical protein
MSTYFHVAQSNYPPEVAMGRDCKAPSIRHSTPSKVLDGIWTVSRYFILHINGRVH